MSVRKSSRIIKKYENFLLLKPLIFKEVKPSYNSLLLFFAAFDVGLSWSIVKTFIISRLK